MRSHPLTYLNFSDELHYLKKETDIEDVSRFLKYLQRFTKEMHFLGDYAFFTVDYTKRKYTLIGGPLFDTIKYHPRDFLDGGLDFLVEVLHKDDFSIINKKTFPITAALFSDQPQKNHNDYVFETSFRGYDGNGDSFTVLQKGSYITDPTTKLPLYSFGIFLNITPFKKDNVMVQIIGKRTRTDNGSHYTHIATNYFYPTPEDALLSKKEKEILKWMADGFSSKQIADKFHLSINTVMNHRKNMLRKANAKNAAELIRYAIMNHII